METLRMERLIILLSLVIIGGAFLSSTVDIKASIDDYSLIRANPLSGIAPLTVQFTGWNELDARVIELTSGDGVTYRYEVPEGDYKIPMRLAHTYLKEGSYHAHLTIDGYITEIVDITVDGSAEELF